MANSVLKFSFDGAFRRREVFVFALISCSMAFLVFGGEVKMCEDSITLPTYAPGGYDKTPLFYTGRVYQGAQGRVYPYPMQDVLHDGKVDETYKYLTLENDWLQMGLLPEHGGHLLNFTDKATGYETFYRQHVIKPALIGMLGAWISGGVEWNFPHHPRATTAMPIDWRMVANKDGSKTIWIGETELRRRLKWTIGLSLLPDRAVLQAENFFMNRQPWIESMIYWANVSVHCGDDYQILFPPDCHLGFDHHKNYWTSFPIGPRKEAYEKLPSQRSKYANDIAGTMDLSWWRNFTIESRSIFAMDPDNAWLAGYDHKKKMGTAHVSNRHITVGKKFFLWGNFPEAHVWDKVLPDNDGPYLELMVGCWSDNQPDYSWIAPYETRTVKQYWFQVKGIGGMAVVLKAKDRVKNRVVAIKMLTHVVGDMHCPAHAYFAKMPPRQAGSKAGYHSSYGFFNLYYKGKKTTYHGIWDAALERVHRGLGQKVGRYTELIDKDITPEYRKEILQGMPYEWACDNLPRAWKIYEWAKPGDQLDESFYQEHGAYVDDQVLRGGYRLAKLLNLAFDENYHGE